MEELFSKLQGAELVTVFDLKIAYLQQPVDNKTTEILSANTYNEMCSVLR